jgi:large subunit ribosomal protein L21
VEKTMKIAIVRPKEVIKLVAGMIGLLFDRLDGDLPISGETLAETRPHTELQPMAESRPAADDLTKINGIGPAFARRLAEAGVSTYAQLAGMTANEVRQRAQIAEWQGDPQDWISQAAAMKTG